MEEIRDMIISILALTLVFSFPDIESLFFVSFIIVSISFLLCEIGHKIMATRLGCTATFKLWPPGIMLSLFSIALKYIGGFGIFTPGHIEIAPYKFGRWGIKVIRLTPHDLGIISLAGVGINIILAYVFLLIPGEFFSMLSQISALLAFFNLLPIPPLDGSRIFLWSFSIWFFLMSITTIVLFVL